MQQTSYTADELLSEIQLLKERINALQKANRDLEYLLTEKTAELQKTTRELNQKIAERIVFENNSHVSMERYKTLIDNIPGAVYRYMNDSPWTMEYISDQIKELTGYPASDFIGNRIRSYMSIIHSDDVFHVVNIITEAIQQKKSYEIDYRIINADGSVMWIHEKGRGVFADNETLLSLDGVIFANPGKETQDESNVWK